MSARSEGIWAILGKTAVLAAVVVGVIAAFRYLNAPAGNLQGVISIQEIAVPWEIKTFKEKYQETFSIEAFQKAMDAGVPVQSEDEKRVLFRAAVVAADRSRAIYEKQVFDWETKGGFTRVSITNAGNAIVDEVRVSCGYASKWSLIRPNESPARGTGSEIRIGALRPGDQVTAEFLGVSPPFQPLFGPPEIRLVHRGGPGRLTYYVPLGNHSPYFWLTRTYEGVVTVIFLAAAVLLVGLPLVIFGAPPLSKKIFRPRL